jgi:hypothetical protein
MNFMDSKSKGLKRFNGLNKKLMKIMGPVNRHRIALLFAVLIITFSVFIAIRPYEQDESHYILSGMAILKGEIDPFMPFFISGYSNPFSYIVGSPLVPVIYGAAYMHGGIFLTRVVSMISVLVSIYLVYIMVRKRKGNYTIPVLILGFSSCTILLASNAFLDSIALLFMVVSLYFADSKKMFLSGLFGGLAMISKFILFLPFIFIILYMAWKRERRLFLVGLLIILVPFSILYIKMYPSIMNFVFNMRMGGLGTGSALFFIDVLQFSLPVATFLVLIMARKWHVRKHLLFLIPTITILLYHIYSLGSDSLRRHLPYMEFPAAVIIGLSLKKINPKYYIFIAIYIYLSMSNALTMVNSYPSYNLVMEEFGDVNGRVLALNQNVYMLIKGMPLNSTSSLVFDYYVLYYDDKPGSTINDYELAIKNGYFDYALISSQFPKGYEKYRMIEEMVREYYCPLYESDAPNGIDIYKRCDVGQVKEQAGTECAATASCPIC